MKICTVNFLIITLIVFLPITLLTQTHEGEKGDVNNDGTINVLDALKVVNHVLETDTLDDQEFWRADCNSSVCICDGDSFVNVLDVIKIVDIVLEVDYCLLVDIDGNTYQTIQIGDQCWMAENLKVTHYRNGDPIPNVISNSEWTNLTTGAYSDYNNDINKVYTYGRLYNWYAVCDWYVWYDDRSIAPEGWHVPSDEEWQTLIDYLGGSSVAGNKMKTMGTVEGGTGLWYSPNTGATNESGFSALPGGYRSGSGSFYAIGGGAYFWSSTRSSHGSAWSRRLYYNRSDIGRVYKRKKHGFSVRCVRDD